MRPEHHWVWSKTPHFQQQQKEYKSCQVHFSELKSHSHNDFSLIEFSEKRDTFYFCLVGLLYIQIFAFSWLFFSFGPLTTVLRAYSWICTQKSLLVDSGTKWGAEAETWVGCVQGKPNIHCMVGPAPWFLCFLILFYFFPNPYFFNFLVFIFSMIYNTANVV